jgi:ring-1,2-phenylacetyl-CoA epoxidase subunit PaaC
MPKLEELSSSSRSDVVEYLIRLGDDRLILGHRLSEWCGHAPILEEDLAIANIALDLVGQANMFLELAGTVEGQGRDADALAYFRETVDYRNAQIVELPRGDFGFTIVRQFLVSAWSVLLLEQLQQTTLESLGGIAAKALKETRYHLRHSAEWVIRLGDGTAESHDRVQRALDELWRFTAELFERDAVDARLMEAGIGVDASALREAWQRSVADVAGQATLSIPKDEFMMSGGRRGRHTEHLGHLLAEMQIVARSHPGAKW